MEQATVSPDEARLNSAITIIKTSICGLQGVVPTIRRERDTDTITVDFKGCASLCGGRHNYFFVIPCHALTSDDEIFGKFLNKQIELQINKKL